MKRELLMGGVVLLILLGMTGYLWSNKLPWLFQWVKNQKSDNENTEIYTEEGSDRLIESQRREVTDIAQEFTELYMRAVGSNSEKDALAAKNLLTERGRIVVEKNQHPSAGLILFTYRLPTPQRVTIGGVAKATDEFVEVASHWIYDDKTLDRYFYLRLEGGEWKIDSIQQVEQ